MRLINETVMVRMVFKDLTEGAPVTDEVFDSLYSKRIQKISEFYFTPIDVAIRSAHFLTERPEPRILDIGSGAGKFCLIGATVTTGHFTGVEHDKRLFVRAKKIMEEFQIHNISFVLSDITSIPFTPFNGFYLFNPFMDLLQQKDNTGTPPEAGKEAFHNYTRYVFDQLESMPKGTRLVTYFAHPGSVPLNYTLMDEDFDGKLKMWIRS